MASTTPNFNLVKPSDDDFYDVQDFNANADKIDTALKNAGKTLDAAATYTTGYFELTGLPDPLPDVFTLRFSAPVDYTAGDKLRAGSTELTVVVVGYGGATPSKVFLAGQTVSFSVSGGVAYLGAGGIDPTVPAWAKKKQSSYRGGCRGHPISTKRRGGRCCNT